MGVGSNISASYKMILLQIYPVGSIYESVIDNDPNEFIGGTWVRLGKGRMLIGSDGEFDSSITHSPRDTIVTFDEDLWTSTVPNLHAGVYRFIYDGDTSWWTNTELGEQLDISYYGINISGHLTNGVYIDVTVTSSESDYPLGSEGGESNHTLTLDEIPSHKHSVGLDTFSYPVGSLSRNEPTVGLNYTRSVSTISLGSTGKSEPHENMPPYVVYYAWERLE